MTTTIGCNFLQLLSIPDWNEGMKDPTASSPFGDTLVKSILLQRFSTIENFSPNEYSYSVVRLNTFTPTGGEPSDLFSDSNPPVYNVAYPQSARSQELASSEVLVTPLTGTGGLGYNPTQILTAYGFSQLPSANNGAGQTIYIVDAYDDPYIQSDLTTFNNTYGLQSPPNFNVVYTQGSTQVSTAPSLDPSGYWAEEESLDVEWSHAIAPGANIVLVEAASNSFTDLLGGIQWATNNGAHIVSMSWGVNSFSDESYYDSYLNQPGVAFFASAGDSASTVSYPASSPYVVSVGGTSLTLNPDNTIASETAWSSGGGGVDTQESQPAYQSNYGLSLGGRGTPDVSYNADPITGFSVYDTLAGGFIELGGTSGGAPQWAGLTAIVDQDRLAIGANYLSSNTASGAYTDIHSLLYSAGAQTALSDITSGSNGYYAGPGYDLATGLGSPIANYLVPYLAYGITHVSS